MEQIQQPLSEETTVMENVSPIFIGCDQQEIITKLNDFVKNMNDNTPMGITKYELAIMSSDIFNKSLENWFFSRLSKEQQENIQKTNTDDKMRREALMVINTFKQIAHIAKGLPFTPKELKEMLLKYQKKNLTNKQVDEVLGLLIGFGYIIDTTPENRSHEKKYKLSLDETAILQSLQISRKQVEAEINNKNKELEVIDTEMRMVSSKLMTSDEQIPEEQPKKKVRKSTNKPKDTNTVKKSKKKKAEAINENGELQETTDFLNDRINGESNTGTETFANHEQQLNDASKSGS